MAKIHAMYSHMVCICMFKIIVTTTALNQPRNYDISLHRFPENEFGRKLETEHQLLVNWKKNSSDRVAANHNFEVPNFQSQNFLSAEHNSLSDPRPNSSIKSSESDSYLKILGISDYSKFQIPVIGGYASPPVVKHTLIKNFQIGEDVKKSAEANQQFDSQTSQSVKQEQTHGIDQTNQPSKMDFFHFLSNLKATPKPDRKSLSQLISERNSNFVDQRNAMKKMEKKTSDRQVLKKTDSSTSENAPSGSIRQVETSILPDRLSPFSFSGKTNIDNSLQDSNVKNDRRDNNAIKLNAHHTKKNIDYTAFKKESMERPYATKSSNNQYHKPQFEEPLLSAEEYQKKNYSETRSESKRLEQISNLEERPLNINYQSDSSSVNLESIRPENFYPDTEDSIPEKFKLLEFLLNENSDRSPGFLLVDGFQDAARDNKLEIDVKKDALSSDSKLLPQKVHAEQSANTDYYYYYYDDDDLFDYYYDNDLSYESSSKKEITELPINSKTEMDDMNYMDPEKSMDSPYRSKREANENKTIVKMPLVSTSYANVGGNVAKSTILADNSVGKLSETIEQKKVKNRYVRPNSTTPSPPPLTTTATGDVNVTKKSVFLEPVNSIKETTTSFSSTPKTTIVTTVSTTTVSPRTTIHSSTISSNQAYIDEVYRKQKKTGINIGNPLNITNLETIPNLTKTLKSFLLKDGISYKKIKDGDVQSSKVTAKNVPKEVVRERIRLLRLLKEHKASIENSPFSRSNHSYLQVRTPVKLFQVLNGDINLSNKSEPSKNRITHKNDHKHGINDLFEQIISSGNIEEFFDYYLTIHRDCEAIRDREKYSLCEYFRATLSHKSPRSGRHSQDPLDSIGTALKSKAILSSNSFKSTNRPSHRGSRRKINHVPKEPRFIDNRSKRPKTNTRDPSLNEFLLQEPERVVINRDLANKRNPARPIPDNNRAFQNQNEPFQNFEYPSYDYTFGRFQPARAPLDYDFDYYDYQRTVPLQRSQSQVSKVKTSDLERRNKPIEINRQNTNSKTRDGISISSEIPKNKRQRNRFPPTQGSFVKAQVFIDSGIDKSISSLPLNEKSNPSESHVIPVHDQRHTKISFPNSYRIKSNSGRNPADSEKEGKIQQKPVNPKSFQPSNIPGFAGRDYPDYVSVPKTGFRCPTGNLRDHIFVDYETRCQVYHRCRHQEMTSYLCPVGHIFDIRTHKCELWIHVHCN